MGVTEWSETSDRSTISTIVNATIMNGKLHRQNVYPIDINEVLRITPAAVFAE